MFDHIGLVSSFTLGAESARSFTQRQYRKTPRMACGSIKTCQNHNTEEVNFRTFEHLETHMFGDRPQEGISSLRFSEFVQFFQVNQIGHAMLLGDAHLAPNKVMTVPQLELPAALFATRWKQDICRALTLSINMLFMWTVSTTFLQLLNSTSKNPKFIVKLCIRDLKTH